MSFNTFTSTPSSEEDLAALQKMADEQHKRQQELLKQQKKLIDDKTAALKGESEAEQRSRKLREARERRDKEWEDIEIADYEEKLKRDKEVKERKENLEKLEDKQYEDDKTAAEKLKNSPILDLIPDGIKNAKTKEEPTDNTKDSMLSKIGDMIKIIPNALKNTKTTQESGEQKNLGEQIQRVSFHPEGIKILRTLLDPIYKSLNSFTVDMDKGLKSIIDNMKNMFSGKGGGGLGALLLLALADIIFISEKLVKTFKVLKDFTVGIGEFFVKMGKQLEEVGMAFKRFLIDPFVKLGEKLGINKWIEETVLNVSKTFGKLKLDVLTKLSEIGTGIMERLGVEKIFNKIKFTKDLFLKEFEPMIEAFKDTGKIFKDTWKWVMNLKDGFTGFISRIGNMFSGEGIFATIVETFKSFTTGAKNLTGPIQTLFSIFKPFTAVLEMLIVPLKWIAKIISIPLIQAIDGIVTGFKTFLSVINDDALSPLQKATSVVAGFFGGLGSLISEFVSFFGTVLKLIGKIPLLGFVGKAGEAVSSFAEKIDTHKLGEQTADLFRTMNGSEKEVKDAYKTGAKYQNASPEERKKMDERYAKMSGTNTPENVPKPAPSAIAQPSPAPAQQAYQPAPEETAQPASAQVVAFQEGNKQMVNSVNRLTDIIQKNAEQQNKSQGGTTIINQTQQSGRSDSGTKDYLLKPIRDINYDKRMSWWNSSLQIRSTL